ncbi:hypothetical protein GCM10027203_57940 [Nonomuraea fastidiosa]
MMSVGLARKAVAFSASSAALAALAAGLVAGPAQAATASKPKVTATTPKASPRAHEGSCPVTVNFSAKIKVPVNGKTKLAYRWLHGDGSKSKVKELTVKGKGTKTVTVKQSITFKEDVKGWEAVQVLGPKKFTSKKSYFSVSCVSLKEVVRDHGPKINARAWTSYSSYAHRCAPGDKVNFTGVISSSRPAWVRYRWVLNGHTADYGKIKVRDSRKVGFSISPRHSQRGWAQLQVLSPDSESSNRTYYKVACKDGHEAPKPRGKVSASANATVVGSCTVKATGSITATGAGRVSYRWSLNGRTVSNGQTYFGRDGGTILVPAFSTELSGPDAKGGVVTLTVTGPNNSDSSSDRYPACRKAPADKPEPKPSATTLPAPAPEATTLPATEDSKA